MGLTGEPAVAASFICWACMFVCVCVVCLTSSVCARARLGGDTLHLYSRWMCVKLFLVLMYVFTSFMKVPSHVDDRRLFQCM